MTHSSSSRWILRKTAATNQAGRGEGDADADSHHSYTVHLGGKLYLAPLGKNMKVWLVFHRNGPDQRANLHAQKAVDIGTGTGPSSLCLTPAVLCC